jgi:hypothetical protein
MPTLTREPKRQKSTKAPVSEGLPTSRRPELSFRKNRPILKPEDLRQNERPVCTPMDKEWRRSIQDKFWATNFKGDLRREIAEGMDDWWDPDNAEANRAVRELQKSLTLRDRILQFGGEQVCMPVIEEDIDTLLAHGEVWLPTGLIMRRGRPCGCHENTALLWDDNRDVVTIATGYYLSKKGGMWRQHSWCIAGNSRGGRVVETTNKGVLYYGVCLNLKESKARVENAW